MEVNVKGVFWKSLVGIGILLLMGLSGCPQQQATISSVNPNPVNLQVQINQSSSGSFGFSNSGNAALVYTTSKSQNWLNLTSNASGTVSPGETVSVGFTATCPANSGTLSDTIVISSNAVNQATVNVAINLTCEPGQAPVISAPNPNPVTLQTRINQSTSGSFSFGNTGESPLSYSIVSIESWLSVTAGGTGTVTPGATASVGLSATCPGTEGNLSGTVTINSNASNQPALPVTVNLSCAAGVASDYNIQLVFAGTSFTPARRAVFEQSAARWSDVITGNLSSVTVAPSDPIPANFCGAGHPSFSGVIDDILIFANIGPIDGPGGILGQAGPCLIRLDGTNLPVVGFMQFDEADVAALEAEGTFESVILHEMGHVFGIGTFWDVPSLGFNLLAYTTNPPGASCRDAAAFSVPPGFTGAAARAEYTALGGSGNVPVEDEFGPGTRCGHWDEGLFGNELMTGFAEPAGTPMPLSRLTIASLADVGYQVSFDTAEPYSIPSCAPNCGKLQAAAIDQPWEIVLSPIGFLTPEGTMLRFEDSVPRE